MSLRSEDSIMLFLKDNKVVWRHVILRNNPGNKINILKAPYLIIISVQCNEKPSKTEDENFNLHVLNQTISEIF